MPRVADAIAALPCRPGGRGWCAAVAGILEATAPKPGNVHPEAAFPDLTYDDLVAAALAIAPMLDEAPRRPLGRTILAAVEAARAAADTNANLGIVLLTAPLAAVPDGIPLHAAAVDRVLSTLGPADAADVYRAISIAKPGGMGEASQWDLAGPPPDDLRAAMRAAADRDEIAQLWATGFGPLFAGPVVGLAADLADRMPIDEAVVRCHMRLLAVRPDTLIARRHGEQTARDVSAQAAAVVHLPTGEWAGALTAFDRSLRAPRRLNPGTTADLVAAALYILLRDGRLRPDLPSPVGPPP